MRFYKHDAILYFSLCIHMMFTSHIPHPGESKYMRHACITERARVTTGHHDKIASKLCEEV